MYRVKSNFCIITFYLFNGLTMRKICQNTGFSLTRVFPTQSKTPMGKYESEKTYILCILRSPSFLETYNFPKKVAGLQKKNSENVFKKYKESQDSGTGLNVPLIHIRPMLHSYKNKSVDLNCKSID